MDYESNSTANFSLVPEQTGATSKQVCKKCFICKTFLDDFRYKQSRKMDEWDNCNCTLRWLQPLPKTKTMKNTEENKTVKSQRKAVKTQRLWSYTTVQRHINFLRFFYTALCLLKKAITCSLFISINDFICCGLTLSASNWLWSRSPSAARF